VPLHSHPTPAGFVLGGLHGSSGKTVLSCLLAAGLEARAQAVQPFKTGPDFLDTGYHNAYCSRPSRNLDAWLMGEALVRDEAVRHTAHATGILEGVMGLFDGASPTSEEGSTMELARWLDWPVVLCLPAEKAGRSIAAMLRGFLAEAHPSRIAGVVLNGVSGASHSGYLREALAPLQVPVLGAIPKTELLIWPERHLGLQAAQEQKLPSKAALAALAEQTLDLSAFSALAQSHPLPQAPASTSQLTATALPLKAPDSRRPKRIAIAQDEAFHFYYAANLEWLRAQDAELVPFSPLHSPALPSECDAVLLGGGFPEIYASSLADNTSLRRSLSSAIGAGLPCYAECGGLMLLSEELVTREGHRFPMAGVLPGSVNMSRSLQNFGYCLADSIHRGHEFHHSQWQGEAEHANAWSVTRRRTGTSRREGFRTPTLHASYVHLYFSQSAALLRQQLSLSL